MNTKYEQELIENAMLLDKSNMMEPLFYKLVIRLIEEGDINLTRKLCDELRTISKSGKKNLISTGKALYDSLIKYYGYLRLREICNPVLESTVCDKSIDELMNELNALIGLQRVKDQVADLIAFQRVRKKRESVGLFAQKSTLHMAFTGNPGTGKTTVARIVGGIYKQLGLLSKGHFIEVSRTDLIAGYQGQTAHKVKAVMERAKGGVLFIDEAYSLTENDHSDSYGRECLTELTKALEDYREDLVVIVAGYTEPMNMFFESNPGLRSRFNIFIEFDDYQENELLAMFQSLCSQNAYLLSSEAEVKITEIITEKVKNKDDKFANGRLVRNMYETVIMNQARRVNRMKESSVKDLQQIMVNDVQLCI